MATMKNLVVFYEDQSKLETKLEDVSRLTQKDLQPHEVLIKVAVAGSNPKDYKHPLAVYFNNRLNKGDDCAGTVAGIGSAVQGFAVGDRVAGFHVMDTPNGTYAEYTICPYQTVMHLPDSISDEEAATLPLAIFTAAVGLYRNLQLPAPWDRSDARAGRPKIPLVVNGAGSAVGSLAIKLAKLNPLVGPIIATAGSSVEHVKALGVDAIVNYRSETVAEDVKTAAGGLPINHFFDAANSAASVKYACEILQPNTGRYTSTLPVAPHPYYDPDGKMEKELKAVNVWYEQIWVGDVHDGKKAGGSTFGAIMSKVTERALADGTLSGHPCQVVENGLEGVGAALIELRDRKKGGNRKFVTRIADTPALKSAV
ncbi:hypothetical protein KC331_g16774 [Hortaea werneckii]|uniref:Enoyl reductase (ER) domain-containing protein n=1 Tax=Hortaea werneckii TaxID=91943 RepID=A0A3M7B813_HORWE|nr:hypothetical protein KC331_g16774 [Hortaea werneckii]KAI7699484.1 hypothetical protein KC353_g16449 [Hortaea werneckii]RMY35797.1 hypothetical protein D0865_13815 [Hortaea werneckii]